MSVSVSQEFVHFWVKKGKREGTFLLTLNRDGSTTNPTVSGSKKTVGCEMDLGSHFISELS